jgi:hypothetical protein|tara:strand:- start:2279 stop:2980 length:702 start_codon:yes stop_codon:yes gene_type:complete
MNDEQKKKFFLIIGLKKIKFTALNENNKILLEKQVFINDFSLNENFETLNKFLSQNIFDLEKKLNDYIKEIDLLINYDDFITVDVSTIHNFNNSSNHSDNISNFLINIKDSVIKDMNSYDLIHMIINKFIIDGKEHSSIPSNIDCNNFFLEIRFLCLKKDILLSLKKIFSKYEILVKNISCYKYVNHFKTSNTDNLLDLADKLKNGLNQKEILFINKSPKNVGFFEKFFNFFN